MITLIIRLKWTIFKRLIKQIPLFYKVITASAIVLMIYFLFMADVKLTWKSFLVASIIYFFLSSRIQYTAEHKLLLRQFSNALFSSLLLDTLAISVPFYFVNPALGAIVSVLAFIVSIYRSMYESRVKINFKIPSPFFVKSSYLWHAKVRYLLPTVWMLILLFIVIARVYDNYNLAAVSFGVGALLSFISTILQEEKPEFIKIYISKMHFIQRSLKETIYNAVIFMLVPVLAILLFFPEKWLISLILFLTLILLSVKLIVTKYAFYPSVTLASTIFVMGAFVTGALIVSVYGAIFIPIVLVLLYRQYSKNVSQLITEYETTEY